MPDTRPATASGGEEPVRTVSMKADTVAVDASLSPKVVPVTESDPMPGHTPERPGPDGARAMLGSVECASIGEPVRWLG